MITLPDLTLFFWQLLPKAEALLIVIALDLVLGVVIALKNGVFRWEKLADFLGDYGPKIVGWLAVELLALLPEEFRLLAGVQPGLAWGAFSILFLSAVASVFGHLGALGLLPNTLQRLGIPPTGK